MVGVRVASGGLWWGLAAATAVLVGVLSVAAPLAVGVIAAVIVGSVLMISALGRLFLLVAVGMASLQSDYDVLKGLYLGLVVLSTTIALVRTTTAIRASPVLSAFRPLLAASLATVSVVLVSMPVSLSHGVPFADWSRGALPALMLGAAPWIGLDAGFHATRRHVLLVFVSTTAVAPVAFMSYFLARRGESTLGIERLGLTSICLCIALLALALAQLTSGSRHRAAWLAVALYVPSAVLMSGTRSGLALFGTFLGIVGPRRKGRLPLGFGVTVMVVAAGAVLYLVPLLGSRLATTQDFYGRRLATLTNLLNQNTGAIADQSLSMRAHQTEVVLNTWQSEPILGMGPGYEYGLTAHDTPAMILGYFGLAGLALAVLTVWAWVTTASRVRRLSGARAEVTAIRAFAFGLAAFFPLGSIIDDKGLSLSLALFAALLGTCLASSEPEDEMDAGAFEGATSGRAVRGTVVGPGRASS